MGDCSRCSNSLVVRSCVCVDTGALVDYNDGYVGCMRGLRVNGKLMDMAGELRKGEKYGVVRGRQWIRVL